MDIYLKKINKPSRYINSEWNSIKKDRADIRICFCFPDLYELGASNIGLEILYSIVNLRKDAVAERCYCPDIDMQELMKKENIKLFSLETETSLDKFDIIGFSLQYELSFTNVLTMLELAGIPVFRKERESGNYPLIIGGGPITSNPEPIAEFFDFFVIGEGEDVINDIIDKVIKFKKEHLSRDELFKELEEIEGIYVPSLWNITYKNDGRIEKVISQKNKFVQKRTVDIKSSLYPVKPVVPYVETIHDRFTVEISRGCIYGCRFCQASGITRPWRERSKEKIVEIIKEGLKNTGFEEVSLLSFCIGEHSGIKEILVEVSDIGMRTNTSISVPSLRCTPEALDILKYLVKPHRANITFAIETASPKLQRILGKEIDLNLSLETLLKVHNMGWQLVKLYFMFGLPAEIDKDLELTVEFVRKIRRLMPYLGLNITLSPFVPKPHTPFQFAEQLSSERITEKKHFLIKGIKGNLKLHSLEMAEIEGIFSRGDRRLSEVIYRAWRKGAGFDNWKERFRYDIWNLAFKESGIDKEFYLREREISEILPWEHIKAGKDKETLFNEYKKAVDLKEKILFGGFDVKKYSDIFKTRIKPEDINLSGKFFLKNTTHYRMRFSRKGKLRFLSHAEQIKMIRRIFRRTQLPVAYTTGYHPQPKISFGPAISVGYESESEYIDVEMTRPFNEKELALCIMKECPSMFELMEIKRISSFTASIESSVNLARYQISFIPVDEIRVLEALSNFKNEKELIYTKVKGDRIENINLVEIIKEINYRDGKIDLLLRFSPHKNLKPEKILSFILKLDESEIWTLSICRKDIYFEQPDGSIKYL